MIIILEGYLPICQLLKECKKIRGRKRFQKLVFLAKIAGIPFKETFEWNNYGPFSKELAQEIDTLCKLDLIEEDINNSEYYYTLTKKGEEFLDEMWSKVSDKYERLSKILPTLNEYDTQDLEKLASIKFLISEGFSDSYIKSFLNYTKNYGQNEVDEGKASVETLFNNLTHF